MATEGRASPGLRTDAEGAWLDHAYLPRHFRVHPETRANAPHMKIARRRVLPLSPPSRPPAAAALGIRSAAARYYDGPVSDHFDGVRFFDPQGAPPQQHC